MSRDDVFKVLVHVRTSLEAFTDGLFTYIMISSVRKKTEIPENFVSGGLAGKADPVGEIVVNIFGNMKLVFAVFLLVTVGCVSLSF